VTPETALIELLGRVGASQSIEVLVNNDELGQWPSTAVAAMKGQKLIVKACPTSSAICPGCERECVMPVYILPATSSPPVSFIVCDKRSDTNRVQVSGEQLIQWRCSAHAVCGFVAAILGLRSSEKVVSEGLWEIGIAAGGKRSQMLCLQAGGELTLVVGNNKVPLAELIEFHEGSYSLDGAMVSRLVDAATPADPRYTPSDVKREARKLDTRAMYARWQKEYRNLKREKPNKTDVWYSRQIANMEIANGKEAETIRKNMKK
jgi:hypothetical protein